jgi:hypothetical protein
VVGAVAGFPETGGIARIIDNSASGSGLTGFSITSGQGPGYVLIGNISTSNGIGFELNGIGHFVHRNVALNNFTGFSLGGDLQNLRLVGNSSLGNRGAGIFIGSISGPIDIHQNNIYGNVGGYSIPRPNCGIVNVSGFTVDATNNFWGLPSGPGPDPADDAGPGTICQTPLFDDGRPQSETLVVPFATKPFRIQGAPPQAPVKHDAP